MYTLAAGLIVDFQEPDTEPIQAPEIKEWARIDHSEEDNIINKMVKQVDRYIAQQLGVVTTKRQLTVKYMFSGNIVNIPVHPITEILSVNEVTREVAPENFEKDFIDLSGDYSKIKLPSASSRNKLEIGAMCGYDQVPDDILAFLSDAVTLIYNRRGQSIDSSKSITSLPSYMDIKKYQKVVV